MDDMALPAFVLIAATLALCWIVDWCLRLRQRGEDARRRKDAERVLQKHGMEAHTYLPSFSAEPGELRDALAAFDFTNQLVLDRDGRLVGRVLPKVQTQGPGLRLVVDNTT